MEKINLIEKYIFDRKGVKVSINPHELFFNPDDVEQAYRLALKWYNDNGK